MPLPRIQPVPPHAAAKDQATGGPGRRIFFPNLNGLRLLAVLLVIIDHVESSRFDFGLPSYWQSPGLPMLGQLGVTLFFVLSGFLITYLLLAEKETLGRIKFGDFYLRRALRIWPLYYLVVLGLFVLPHIDFFAYPVLTPLVGQHLATKTTLYALMLPNVVKELYPAVPYLSQAWSIGVEEQFYLLWPVLIHCSHRYVRTFLLLAGGIVVLSQLSWALTTPQRHVLPINEVTTFIKNFLYFFRIQCMAIGGIFALVLFRQNVRLLGLLTARGVQVGLWVLLPVMILRGQQVPYFTQELYSGLFGLLILNLACTATSLVSLRHPVLDYLGRISYGVYMLQAVAVVVSIRVANAVASGPWHHVLTYLLTLATVIALAAFSYRFVEKPFLGLKKRFTRIQSGS